MEENVWLPFSVQLQCVRRAGRRRNIFFETILVLGTLSGYSFCFVVVGKEFALKNVALPWVVWQTCY